MHAPNVLQLYLFFLLCGTVEALLSSLLTIHLHQYTKTKTTSYRNLKVYRC